MFRSVLVTPEETVRLPPLGFAIVEYEGRPGFAQPCVQLAGTACRAYADRPADCRRYTCATLAALEDGTIERPEAERRIAEARRRKIDALQAVERGETIEQARTRLTEGGSAELKLALGVLDLVLDRYFRRPRQRRLGRGEAGAMGD